MAGTRNGTTHDDAAADPRRLIEELRRERDEALDQQAATAEVLAVINGSPGDLAPVFEAMLERAMRLCAAAFGTMRRYDGEHFDTVATRGIPPAYAQYLHENPRFDAAGTGLARLVAGEPLVHMPDAAAEQAYDGTAWRALVDLGGARTSLALPLRKEGSLLGTFTLYRQEVRPFTDKQIALLENFAAQAVIAMENARLLTETRQRSLELQEALEFQTATSDVLKVISRSTFDLAPVLEYVVATAIRLCRAHMGSIFRLEDSTYRWAVGLGLDPAYREVEMNARIAPGTGTLVGRVALEGRTVQITDAENDPLYAVKDEARLTRATTMLGVPLLREGSPIGVIAMARDRVEPFSDSEIALVTTFADQAVIAIENVRLLTETREALEQQTATAEVLQVINSSPGDLAPVFDAMLEKATRLCEAACGQLATYDGESFRFVAAHGDPRFIERQLSFGPLPASSGVTWPRIVAGESVVHIADAMDTDIYRAGHAQARRFVDEGSGRSLLTVALRKDDALLGALTVYSREVRPFTDKQIALLRNFAAQAVIAMENARLINETREARDEAETALHHLQTAQSSLVQAQKMAALGQLTAGIAHEIKNPLNFVNNFAGLSTELLDELKDDLAPALAGLGGDKREAVDETIAMLTGNLDKIAEHGRRADNIVKSMLEHSRGVSGVKRLVDLNALVDEALNLAYHGARAQDQSFNITLERDYAEALGPVELAPQEMTRVFLNLFGNGFYAAHKRAQQLAPAKAGGGGAYRPTLHVATRDTGTGVEITIRDNGTGIPAVIRDKLFQPFFTTKPTGEGTGLGLSISYDIVTQQHGGTIAVASEEGAYTEFTIRLPRG